MFNLCKIILIRLLQLHFPESDVNVSNIDDVLHIVGQMEFTASNKLVTKSFIIFLSKYIVFTMCFQYTMR